MARSAWILFYTLSQSTAFGEGARSRQACAACAGLAAWAGEGRTAQQCGATWPTGALLRKPPALIRPSATFSRASAGEGKLLFV